MIDYRRTQSVANNQLASAQRSAAGRTSGGQGLGRGAGQMAADRFRAGVARAEGQAAASGTRQQDEFANQNFAIQDAFGRRDTRQQYDTLNEQMNQSLRDSRFNNLTTAWGALAGLLR
jgi:hypothetical protein